MEVNEIVEKLSYYTPELPREAIKEALKKKDEITSKLLEMLEYTKENLEKIYDEDDEFFGYIYAFFILAEFREKSAFPYLIDLIKKDEQIVEYILGDEYTEYLPRLLASTYDGNDNALFEVIENKEIDEFIRSCTLQTFSILYLYGVKKREFLVNYFKKLLEQKEADDDAYLYEEIIKEICDLKLVELKEKIDFFDDDKEREEFKKILEDGEEINRNIYPLKPFYEYIYDTVGIMEEWQCFCYKEDEEFENSDDYKICQLIIRQRESEYSKNVHKVGRNDLCPCGSGKKYKKCCLNKNNKEEMKQLALIDEFVCKAEWYLKRNEIKKAYGLLRPIWFDVKEICQRNNIKSIDEYDEKYASYDSLLNWIQDYEEILANSEEDDKLYERLKLCDDMEELFDLDDETQIYWKEKVIRDRANTEFRLGNKEKATEIIENYLKVKPEWTWGYVEMADWYDNRIDTKNYDIKKAKEILLRAEKIENIEDKEAIYERLEMI